MKNPPTFLYEKFTPVTPRKESCKNNKRSRSYKPLFERHFGKTFRDMASFVFLYWSRFGSHGQHCAHGPKTTRKMTGRVLAFPFNFQLEFVFFWFLPSFFAPMPHMGIGQHCAHGPKTTRKIMGRVLAFPFNFNCVFENDRPEPIIP